VLELPAFGEAKTTSDKFCKESIKQLYQKVSFN